MKPCAVHYRLAGGLGNQLFIYSAGLDYAFRTGRRVVYDAYDVAGPSFHHDSGLQKLSVKRKIFKRTFWLGTRRRLVSLLGVVLRRFKLPPVDFSSPELGYSESVFAQIHALTVRGHFQTYRHLLNPEVSKEMATLRPNLIRREFRDAIESMTKTHSLSIHIRLGDYVPLKSKFGLLSPDYFSQAVSTAFAQTNQQIQRVCLFSDDLPRALSYLERADLKGKPLLTFDGLTDEEELFLMAESDHLIISNSTFSWWSGALGNSEKIVIAPAKWFKSLDDPKDLYPASWIKIPSQWI